MTPLAIWIQKVKIASGSHHMCTSRRQLFLYFFYILLCTKSFAYSTHITELRCFRCICKHLWVASWWNWRDCTLRLLLLVQKDISSIIWRFPQTMVSYSCKWFMCPAKQFAMTHVVIFLLCACNAVDRLVCALRAFFIRRGTPRIKREWLLCCDWQRRKVILAFLFWFSADRR